MKKIKVVFLLMSFFFLPQLFYSAPIAHYRNHGSALLPDPSITPGIVRTTNPQLVCHEDTKKLRKPGDRSVFVLYGVKPKELLPGIHVENVKTPLYEIDHLIPLELGGDNGIKNEWPQPYYEHPGAREKDKLENYLHQQVCSGFMTLLEAQKSITTDWYAAYLKMEGK